MSSSSRPDAAAAPTSPTTTNALAVDKTGMQLRFTLQDDRVVSGCLMNLDEESNSLWLYHSEVVHDPDAKAMMKEQRPTPTPTPAAGGAPSYSGSDVGATEEESRELKRKHRDRSNEARLLHNNLKLFRINGSEVKEVEEKGLPKHRAWSTPFVAGSQPQGNGEAAQPQQQPPRRRVQNPLWPPARSARPNRQQQQRSTPPPPQYNVARPPTTMAWGQPPHQHHHQQHHQYAQQQGGSMMNQQRPTFYWSVDLSPASTQAIAESPLLHELRHNFGLTPKFEFHTTLFFVGGGRMDAAEAPYKAVEGKEVRVRVLRALVANGLSCASVEILDPPIAALCQNAHPHITLALAPGVLAKESNDVLAAAAAGQLQFQWEIMFDVVGTVVRHC